MVQDGPKWSQLLESPIPAPAAAAATPSQKASSDDISGKSFEAEFKTINQLINQ